MTVGAEAYYKEVYLGLVEEVLNDIEMNDSKPEHEQIGVIQKNSFDELCQYARDKYGEETSTFYANAKLITAEKYKSLPEGEKNNKMFEIMYKIPTFRYPDFNKKENQMFKEFFDFIESIELNYKPGWPMTCNIEFPDGKLFTKKDLTNSSEYGII